MLISLSWLRDYVATNRSAADLGERFLMTSSELEKIIDWPSRFEHVVIGKVLECTKHPDADRLSITKVDIGNSTRTIVCGAPNVATNLTVLVALPGATVTAADGSTFTIKESKLRGVISEGMLCGPDEVGLSNLETDGLMILDSSLKPGTPAAEALGLDTETLDLEITPNRPDLLSYLGLAREVAAFDSKKLVQPALYPLAFTKNHAQLSTKIAPGTKTSRLAFVRLKLKSNSQSPWWLQRRLIQSGMRPISPIVDVTNFVMLELGQPLHAYDAVSLGGKKIEFIATTAQAKDEFETLDGRTRTLAKGDLLITANGKVVSLAGIMGSKDSAMAAATTDVVIEAACFDGPSIRRTSRRLGLRSEASSRFEKGIDPHLASTALQRTVQLLKELGLLVEVVAAVDTGILYAEQPKEIPFNVERFESLIGLHLGVAQAKRILEDLGFTVSKTSKSGFRCVPPTWRPDVRLEEDVMEEVIRIWGYERVPLNLPSGAIKPPEPNAAFYGAERIRSTLVKLGYQETVHLSFTNAAELAELGFSDGLPLANPFSSEQSHLIRSHLSAFLRTLRANQDQEQSRLFEIGSTFSTGPTETRTLSGLWRQSDNPEEALQYVKAALLRLADVIFEPTTSGYAYYLPGSALTIRLHGQEIGQTGVLTPDLLERNKIRRGKAVAYWNVELAPLLADQTPVSYHPKPVFPGSTRDITLTVPSSLPWEKIAIAVEAVKPKLLADWSYIGTYRDKKSADMKAITIRFHYRAADRTITDAEVAAAHETVAKALRKLAS